ncbi:MAG: hypothetical protein ACAH83_06650 [Alphaproteobacteria bacterium]
MAIGIDGFIEERIEQLYVCDEYNLFFLTGQANGTGRRAYITARAFHTLDDEGRDAMASSAVKWTEHGSRVQISAKQGMLSFRDTCTGTTSQVPWTELDPEIQEKLRGKISDPFAKYAGMSTKTSKPFSVGKPLVFKKSP